MKMFDKIDHMITVLWLQWFMILWLWCEEPERRIVRYKDFCCFQVLGCVQIELLIIVNALFITKYVIYMKHPSVLQNFFN